MGILDAPVERLTKATMTTGDLGGAGEAPTSVSQGNSVCPECGRKGGKHKKGCKCVGEKEVGLTKSTPADKTPEPFSSSKTSNWVAKAGGLPNYVQHVAHALVRQGKPESKAIAMAIGIIRNWAEGKGDVSPAVRAAAAKALAQWEKMKASTHVAKAEVDTVNSVELDDPEVQLALQTALRTSGAEELRKSLFTPVEKRFNPRQPRDPHTGQWIGTGGVVPKETELAHRAVGEDVAASPIGGHYYELGKKIQRGEVLTRKERGIAKLHVKNELKKPSELSSTRYRRYRDFAKVHGMNLKTKTKGKHPDKQIGSPGAKKLKTTDAREMSNSEKIKAFEVMHGRQPTSAEYDAAGMPDLSNTSLPVKWAKEFEDIEARRSKTAKALATSDKKAKKQVGNPGAKGAKVKNVPIQEPDPDMERQRAEERKAEREG